MRKLLVLLLAVYSIYLTGCKDSSPITPVDSSNINLVSVYSTNASTNGVYVLPINFRNYALIADGTNGMQIIDVNSPNLPDSVASYDTDGSANDVTAVTINNDLFAFISDYSSGLVVVDISTPSNPFFVGAINNLGGFVNTSFIDVTNEIAYIATSTGYVQIYDISALPNEPTLLTGYYTGSQSVNGLYVSGNNLYIACGDIGMKIVNISNPSTPQNVSVFNTSGIATDVVVNTNYAYVADSYNGMLILNVTNPANPVFTSKFSGSGQILGVFAYNNNVFTADNTYGIENVNVSNPSSPTKSGYIQTNSSANNIYYFSGYIFLAAAEGGLGIYQPTNVSDIR